MMTAKKKILQRLLFLVLFFSLLPLHPLYAETKTYLALGSGPTEYAALQNAFREALESSKGISLETDTYLINMQIAKDRIHAHTEGHIVSYQLLESHWDGHQYTVKIQAEITEGASLQPPAIGTEKIPLLHTALPISIDLAEPALTHVILGKLESAGFTPLLPQKENSILPTAESLHKTVSASPGYCLTGTFTTQDLPLKIHSQYPLFSSQATLTLQLIQKDTQEVILSGQYQGSGIDISRQKAIDNAREQVGNDAGCALVKKLDETLAAPFQEYILSVHKLTDYQQLVSLKEYLSYAANTQDLVVQNFSAGSAALTLKFSGSNTELADLLTQNPNGPIKILAMSSSSIEGDYQGNP